MKTKTLLYHFSNKTFSPTFKEAFLVSYGAEGCSEGANSPKLAPKFKKLLTPQDHMGANAVRADMASEYLKNLNQAKMTETIQAAGSLEKEEHAEFLRLVGNDPEIVKELNYKQATDLLTDEAYEANSVAYGKIVSNLQGWVKEWIVNNSVDLNEQITKVTLDSFEDNEKAILLSNRDMHLQKIRAERQEGYKHKAAAIALRKEYEAAERANEEQRAKILLKSTEEEESNPDAVEDKSAPKDTPSAPSEEPEPSPSEEPKPESDTVESPSVETPPVTPPAPVETPPVAPAPKPKPARYVQADGSSTAHAKGVEAAFAKRLTKDKRVKVEARADVAEAVAKGIPERNAVKMDDEYTVEAKFTGKGFLDVLKAKLPEDAKLNGRNIKLSYAYMMSQNPKINDMKIGDQVTVVNGKMTVKRNNADFLSVDIYPWEPEKREEEGEEVDDTAKEAAERVKAREESINYKTEQEAKADGDIVGEDEDWEAKPDYEFVNKDSNSTNYAVKPKVVPPAPDASAAASTTTSTTAPAQASEPVATSSVTSTTTSTTSQ